MPDGQQGVIHTITDGGLSGSHAPVEPIEYLVGPATSDQRNIAHLRLIPIACFRVDDVRFKFGSSFVASDPSDEKQDIRAELAHLVELLKKHPDSPISVFGHADPVGSDVYNKQLSGRRAIVIYALLISNTDSATAVRLWQQVSRDESWGEDHRQTMFDLTGLPAGTPDSDLFRAYMQKLCPPDLNLGKQDFLGEGADPKGKGDYQGCGEFNPLLIFSKTKNKDFENQKDKTARNDANAPNRRVLVLLFRKGSRIDLTKWPCPRATEGVAGCIKRFWKNADERRSTRLPDTDRKSNDTQDTFACRFYQRITDKSPCDKIIELAMLRIRLIDDNDQPFPPLSYRLEVGGMTHEGILGKDGLLEQLVPVGAGSGKLTLIRKPDNGDPVDFWALDLEITDNLPDSSDISGAQARLNNLGFYAGDQVTGQQDEQTKRALQRFQTLYKIKDAHGDPDNSGILSEVTSDKLKEIYGN
jgi:hypothetical protein